MIPPLLLDVQPGHCVCWSLFRSFLPLVCLSALPLSDGIPTCGSVSFSSIAARRQCLPFFLSSYASLQCDGARTLQRSSPSRVLRFS